MELMWHLITFEGHRIVFTSLQVVNGNYKTSLRVSEAWF